jgi:competence protein ComEC
LQLNILAFVLGTVLLQQQSKLPEMVWGWSLLLIVPASGFLFRVQSNVQLKIINRMLVWAFCLGMGFFWAAACAQWRLADSLPVEWERQDIQIVGVVASLPQKNDRSMRFQFDVEQVITQGAAVPKHIALTWYKNSSLNKDGVPLPAIKTGERWQVTVRLRQPHGNANPHGFDYEAWALERNVVIT